MMIGPIPLQVEYPDVWYDTNVLAIVGTGSWVVAGLAIAYFVLKWLKNSEKFYAALRQQEMAPRGMAGGRSEERTAKGSSGR
ncbi:MAG: hypothetical protein HYX97_01370 [Chloroflexi bacterium]|nr:hypothetical protein [Chloroflexota bacterium]